MQTSIWLSKNKQKHYPSLTADSSSNIVIIGAGITGLTCAYYLSSITSHVLVLDADQIGYGASGRNTGKLTSQHGLIYQALCKQHDRKTARLYYEANEEAIDSVEEIIQKHHIDCGFERCASLVFTQDEMSKVQFQEEYQACLDLHIPCTYVEETSFPFPIEAGIRFSHQAKYDPYRYLLGISDVLDEKGIQIYEHTPVTTIKHLETGYEIACGDYHVHAQRVVMATQYPIVDEMQFNFTKLYPKVSSLAALASPIQSKDMLINTDIPLQSYNQVEIADTSILLQGGNEHLCACVDPSQTKAWLQMIQKQWRLTEPPMHWSTQDYVTFDKLPLIGPLHKQDDTLLFASGFQAWGNTFGNIAAKVLCAYLVKEPSQYASLCDPHRSSTMLTPKYVKANAHTLKEFIKGYLQTSEDVYPQIGEASIIKKDAHTLGVYRDEQDHLYIVDITCPHMGCILSFNNDDKTWDCPCHGSRFSYRGEVIKGPSTTPLQTYGDTWNHVDSHILKDK